MATTTNEPNKIIYSMIGVGKKIDKKVILKDIYLSYFYGAKIGVLGYNGAGKSTLLRILAGVDKEFEGQISFAAGVYDGISGAGAAVGSGDGRCGRLCRRGCRGRWIC